MVLVVLFGGCHDPMHHALDAASPFDGSTNDAGSDGSNDATNDAAVDAAPDPHVYVHVNSDRSDGLPDPNAVVVCLDPTLTIVSHGTTNPAGDATCDLPTGGTVTVVQGTQVVTAVVVHVLTTFRDTLPGDHLRAGRARDPALRTGTPTTMRALLPTGSYDAALLTDCGSTYSNASTGIANVTFQDECRGTTFDILTFVHRAGGAEEFAWRPDVPYVANGDVTIADTFQAMGQASTTIANVPSGVARLVTTRSTRIGHPGSAGFDWATDQRYQEPPPSATQTFQLRDPSGAGRGTRLAAGARVDHAGISSFELETTGSGQNLLLDFTAMPMPTIGSRPHASTTQLTWTETAPAAPSTADVRHAYWQGSWLDAGSVRHNVSWFLVEDPATSLNVSTLTPLPDDLAYLDPSKQPSIMPSLFSNVEYIDYDFASGYAAVRTFGPLAGRPQPLPTTVTTVVHRNQSPTL